MDFDAKRPLSPPARMKFRRAPSEIPVLIEHQGKLCQGTYYIEAYTLSVLYGTSQIVTPLGKMPASTLAKMILREIAAGKSKEVAAARRLPPRER